MDSGAPWRTFWTGGFILSLLSVAAASAFLVFATFQQFSDDADNNDPPLVGGDATPPPTPTTSEGTPNPPSVWAEAPVVFPLPEESGLVPAASRDAADVVVVPDEGPGALVWRYYVPVTSFYAGVDELTSDELRALFAGEIGDWSEVGGIAGAVNPAVVIEDEALVQSFLGLEDLGAARRHNSYTDLLADMGPGAGMIAFVPLELVRPELMAVAVDGADLVRGRGDLTSWPFAARARVAPQTDEGERVASQVTTAATSPVPTITRVAVTGDIIPSRCSLSQIEATGDYGAPMRGEVGEFLASADLTFGTLDASIQDFSEPLRCFEHVNLTAPPEVIEIFQAGGFDAVSIASNHIFDCGEQGFCGSQAFLRTIELLEAAGISTIGGGINLEAALEPVTFDLGGMSFGVLAFDDVAAMDLGATADTPGTAPLDDDYREERASGEAAFFRPAEELGIARFSDAIRTLDAEVDVVIVLVQSGWEDRHDPQERSVKALRAAVDAGADLVVGNQAHHVQAAEVRDGVFIAYALGNFIYDQTRLPGHTQGYVLEATFWGDELANVRLLPYAIAEMHRPEFVDGELRAQILEDVFAAGAELPGE